MNASIPPRTGTDKFAARLGLASPDLESSLQQASRRCSCAASSSSPRRSPSPLSAAASSQAPILWLARRSYPENFENGNTSLQQQHTSCGRKMNVTFEAVLCRSRVNHGGGRQHSPASNNSCRLRWGVRLLLRLGPFAETQSRRPRRGVRSADSLTGRGVEREVNLATLSNLVLGCIEV